MTQPSRWGWLTVKFSPQGGCAEQIVRAIAQCHNSVKLLAYAYTSQPIHAALLAAHERGVAVVAVCDAGMACCRGSLVADLAGHLGHEHVLLDGRHAIAHNKVIILDDEAVLTGSFNFTNAAEHVNAENSLPANSAFLVAYLADFALHQGHSLPWGHPLALAPPCLLGAHLLRGPAW